MEFRWNIRYIVQNSKSPNFNVSKKELKAVKSLKFNKFFRILPADKNHCSVMLHEIEYRDHVVTLQKSGGYEPLSKDPAAKVERKIQQMLAKYKAVLPAEVKRKLTS
jgi:hypothetical protein